MRTMHRITVMAEFFDKFIGKISVRKNLKDFLFKAYRCIPD